MSSFVQAIAKFRGGVTVSHDKNTAEIETVNIESPSLVTIPMQQHIGAACIPVVKARETVMVGQLIADSEAFVSAPIYAPVSGKVKKIQPVLMSNGQQCEAILIENDGLNTYVPDIGPVEVNSKEELIKAARNSGLVGIGGAGFPTHVKLNIGEDTPVDTLIINAAECEPYITSDYREVMEFPERIIKGMTIIMKHLGIAKGIIGIENNKPKGIQLLSETLQQRNDTSADIEVMELKTRYPQGAEKMLIYAATGRRVPTGKLPSAVGCIVMNVSTVSLFYKYLSTGIPLIEKRITVDGDNVNEPKNVLAPIGTPIKDILEFCGGMKNLSGKVILGGPMMGIAQYSTDLPITKQTNAILSFSEKTAKLPAEYPCIRCGRCVEHCPMSLMPVQIERNLKIKNTEMLHKLNVSSCMECGSCSFVCPSGRRLVQYMKQAKILEKEAAK